MGPESTGMAGIHRNDWIPQEWVEKKKLFIYKLKLIT